MSGSNAGWAGKGAAGNDRIKAAASYSHAADGLSEVVSAMGPGVASAAASHSYRRVGA